MDGMTGDQLLISIQKEDIKHDNFLRTVLSGIHKGNR